MHRCFVFHSNLQLLYDHFFNFFLIVFIDEQIFFFFWEENFSCVLNIFMIDKEASKNRGGDEENELKISKEYFFQKIWGCS